jgi:uncharacterized protein
MAIRDRELRIYAMPTAEMAAEQPSAGGIRLEGLDVARGIAFIGMVLVNYGVVMAFSSRNPSWVRSMLDACTGRAAALFVLLAGAGLSLMIMRAAERDPDRGQNRARGVYVRRALVLLVGGYVFYPFWEGDILHYYGVYLALGALIVPLRSGWLLTIAFAVIAGFAAMYLWWLPWRLADLFNPQFWTWSGQAKNLFFNGWHPLFPWFAFLTIGMAVGRLPLQRQGVQLLLLFGGVGLALVANFGSEFVVESLRDSEMPRYESAALIELFTTSCVPPGPFYVFEALGTALAVVGASMLIARSPRLLWLPLARVGRLALTLYVAHVLIGLESWKAMGGREGRVDLHEVFRWWLAAVVISLIFATIWLQFFKRGPLEMLLRRIAR